MSTDEIPIPRTARADEVMRAALAALDRGAEVCVATVIQRHGSAPCTPGQKLVLIEERGQLMGIGTVGGGAVERAVLLSMRAALSAPMASPRIENFRLGPSLGMCCGGSADILVEPLSPLLGTLIVGAGHVGVSTAQLLEGLGFQVTLADGRATAFDDARRGLGLSPGIQCVHAEHDDPEVLEALGPNRQVLIVATHDHQLDQAVIEWGIGQGFSFVGGVGSRAKAVRTRARLTAKGVAPEAVDNVRMPVGLEIGARSPMEIGIAIAAELTAWRAARQGKGRPNRDDSEVRGPAAEDVGRVDRA